MDKYEYNVKSDQIKKLYSQKNYEAAAEIADEIDWYKVKDSAMINRVADIYENLRQYEKAKDILLIAYERSPLGRQLAYKLTILALRTNNFVEADEFYQDFVEMSPTDVTQYLLKYRIAKAKGEDIEVLIQILEAYVDVEMDERWQYELAKLYHQAGRDDKCVQMCNELELWFNDGKYVNKAKELKKLITGVMEEYNKRYAGEAGTQHYANVDSDSEMGSNLNDSVEDGTLAESNITDTDNTDEADINTEKNVNNLDIHEATADVAIGALEEVAESAGAENSSNVIAGDNMDYLLEHAKANEEISDQTFNEEAEEMSAGSVTNTSFAGEGTLELEEISDGEEYDAGRNYDDSENYDGSGYGIDDSDNEDISDDEYDGDEEDYDDEDYDDEDDVSEDNYAGYSPMKYLAESIVDGDNREEEIRRADEILREAEAAAVEAQRAADLAKKFVEEARTRVNMIKGISTSKAVLETGQFAGMTLDEVRAQLDEEERRYESGEYVSSTRQDNENDRRTRSGSSRDYDNSDSKIEIFEFDKSKEGKGKKIGDELTKTAEIDINEIKINLGDSDDIYNTANIQEALAKSMAKLLGDSVEKNSVAMSDNQNASDKKNLLNEEDAPYDEAVNENTINENTINENVVNERNDEARVNISGNETVQNAHENDRIARGSIFGDDYLDDYNNEPTKRINREEINRLLKESRNIYQTVPLSPFLNQEEDGQLGLAEPEEKEEQIEGQMTLEEVLAALDNPADIVVDEETGVIEVSTGATEAETSEIEIAKESEMAKTQVTTDISDTERKDTSEFSGSEESAGIEENTDVDKNTEAETKNIETETEVTQIVSESANNTESLEAAEDIEVNPVETVEDITDTEKEAVNVAETVEATEAVAAVAATTEAVTEASEVSAIEEVVEAKEDTTESEKTVEDTAGTVETTDVVKAQEETETVDVLEEITETNSSTQAVEEAENKEITGAISDIDLAEEVRAMMEGLGEGEAEAEPKSEIDEENQEASLEKEPETEVQPSPDKSEKENNLSEDTTESASDIHSKPEIKEDTADEETSQQQESLYLEDVLEEADGEEPDSEEDEEEKTSKSEADKDSYSSKNHSIPENYRSLFDDFLSTENMEETIADTLDNLINKFDMDGTSKTNNVIITGSAKSGKTTLGLSIIKAANRGRNRSGRKVAKVKATVLNKRGVALAMTQIIGTDLIIEQAGNLMPNTIVDLMIAMKNYTEEMLIVIEDDKAAIDRMLMSSPELKSFFTNRLDIEEMEIEDMVRIAKEYAASQLYDVDEIGELALYAKLDDISGRNPVMSVEDIQEVIDDAIEHANRFSIGKIFGRIKKGKGERGILSEQDFL